MVRKLAALILCICLLTGQSAWAAEPFAPHWAELENEMGAGRSMHLDLSAQLSQWVPFEMETTAAINGLLSHFSFGVDYYQQAKETQFALTIFADGEPLATVTQKDGEAGTEWYSDLNEAVYTLEAGSQAQPLSLMAQSAEDEVLVWEELLLGSISLEDFAAHMTQVLMSEGKAAKSSKNLSKIGRAAKTYKITTDGPGAEAIAAEAVKTLNSPSAEAFVEQLTFSGKKNIFTLYENKDGVILGLNFTGNAAYGDGDARKVSLTWGYKINGEERLDTLSLTAPSVKGKNKLTVKFTWNRAWEAAANTQTLEGSISSTLNSVSTSQVFDMDLKNSKALNGHQISGALQVDTTKNDVKESIILKPTIQTAKTDQGLSFRGQVEVEALKSKKTTLKAILSLSMDPQVDPIFSPMELMEVIALEDLSQEALAETEAELAQQLTQRLLMALMALPQEDLAILQTGISNENWNRVLEAFQGMAP